MLLSDNETKMDMLNNRAIAATVVDLIYESKDAPISIGIHGDWGVGKSSILEMVEDQIAKAGKGEDGSTFSVRCIRFNGWRYQGLDDSRFALMGAIVTELEKDVSHVSEAKDTFKKVWKNFNWLSAAKGAGRLAASLAAGSGALAVLTSAFETLRGGVGSEGKASSAGDTSGDFLEDADVSGDMSANKKFLEFQKNFNELLDKIGIDKLVVLIDDLDRCLPETAIEILEAMRLFMFGRKMAFVIAADEFMIRYAVKKHFPDVSPEPGQETTATDYGFSDNYLEKLIQVPFRIPTLSVAEAKLYILLLLVGSKLDDRTEEYRGLVERSLEKQRKPWKVEDFSLAEVQEVLDAKFSDVREETEIAIQIRDILATQTDGNPRKIKRFINMLLLRYRMAAARGFGESVRMPILAKMMLAEYFYPDFYRAMARHLDEKGICPEMGEYISRHVTGRATGRAAADTAWFSEKIPVEWILTEPRLSEVDLRPYYFACREKEDYFSDRAAGDKIRETVSLLMSGETTIDSHREEIAGLNEKEADKVFDLLCGRIAAQREWSNMPRGIYGLRLLVEQKQELQEKLLAFIKKVDVSKTGTWFATGWDRCFSDTERRRRLQAYMSWIF